MPAKCGCARWPNIANRFAQIVRQGLVDIMLMSASTNDVLTIGERLFENSHVTPAAPRQRHHRHLRRPRRPLSRAAGPALSHGDARSYSMRPRRLRAAPNESAARTSGCTASRSTTASTTTCERSKNTAHFRTEAEAKGFRHFLEVFDPNAPNDLRPEQVPAVHQRLDRAHAGRRGASRPAGVFEDRLSRPAGDGRSRRLRSASGRRHSRRRVGHDLRRVQAVRRGPEVRRPRRAVRPQDQQRPNASWPSSSSCAGSSITRFLRKKPCERITACCKRSRFVRTDLSKTILCYRQT